MRKLQTENEDETIKASKKNMGIRCEPEQELNKKQEDGWKTDRRKQKRRG